MGQHCPLPREDPEEPSLPDEFYVYEQTGNLMDLLLNEKWLREAVRIEEEADCDLGAGYDWGASLGAVMANPREYIHFVPIALARHARI